jgi:hypothetical protein
MTGEGKASNSNSQTGISKMVDEVFVPFRPMGGGIRLDATAGFRPIR